MLFVFMFSITPNQKLRNKVLGSLINNTHFKRGKIINNTFTEVLQNLCKRGVGGM